MSLRILLEMEIRSRDINNLSLRFTLRHIIPDTWNSVTLLLLCNACMDFLKEIFGKKKQTNLAAGVRGSMFLTMWNYQVSSKNKTTVSSLGC